MIKKEASRLNNISTLNQSSRFYIVYDNNISPPAHGDFMNMTMLARWFAINNITTNFIVIKHQTNIDNWSEFSENARKAFIDFQNNWVKAFEPVGISVSMYEWNEFVRWSQQKNENEIIVFETDVLKKKMIVRYAFNLLNILTNGASESILTKWRLKTNASAQSDIAISKPYIAWNIRRSNILSELNNTSNQIVEIYRFLKTKFPNYSIIILSDSIGTKFAKEIAIRNEFNIIFSKEIPGNNSYSDDANLILNSNFYFQLSGGGMSTIAFFSNVPYLIFQKPSYEKESFYQGLNWSRNDQKFICLNHWSPIDVRPILNNFK